jgi:molecular chaperone DnaJ
MPRDPYDVLSVPRDASEQQIKKSFRRLATELHPDVNPDDPQAEERFKEAAAAYEILSDSERRATFDRYGHDGLRAGGYAPNFDSFGSIGDLFSAFFGEAGGFGAGGFGARAGSDGGGDVAATVDIDLHEAASGVAAKVRYEVVERCDVCHGNGAEPGTPIETCERCGGSGQLQMVTRTPFGQMVRTGPCDVCQGQGRVPRSPCKQCQGRGRRAVKRELDVDVPAGIADGQRIRVGSQGHAAGPGGAAGDLYVLVRVREHERFVREGQDLITVLDVPAPAAALGAELEVQTLGGTMKVQVPAGTQPGEVLTLRHLGMPALGRARHGHLRVVLNVVIPRNLTDEQRELAERLRESLTDDNLNGEESMFAKLRRTLRHHQAA